MDQQVQQQVMVGVLLLAAGASGWLLPYRWNLLRLRRGLDQLVSERARLAIPKVVGTILALIGIGILGATLVTGRFQ